MQYVAIAHPLGPFPFEYKGVIRREHSRTGLNRRGNHSAHFVKLAGFLVYVIHGPLTFQLLAAAVILVGDVPPSLRESRTLVVIHFIGGQQRFRGLQLRPPSQTIDISLRFLVDRPDNHAVRFRSAGTDNSHSLVGSGGVSGGRCNGGGWKGWCLRESEVACYEKAREEKLKQAMRQISVTTDSEYVK